MELRLPYSSLTKIDSTSRTQYHDYLWLKSSLCGLTTKDGFVANKEVKVLSTKVKSLGKQLNSLASTGFISKDQYGYTLTSTKTINKNLNLTTTKKNGKQHTPFVKMTIPSNVDKKAMEVLRMYFLIQQIFIQYQFRMNGSTNRKLKGQKRNPENFQLSFEKIMHKGKYNSKMEVSRIIDKLENMNLVKISRGKKNDTGYYDCNRYTLLPLSKANWFSINDRKIKVKGWFLEEDKPTKKPVLKEKVVFKKKTVYNKAELIFKKCLDAGLQDILVDAGQLTKNYKSYGMKKGRKVTKKQMSDLLIYSLNDSQLREILFTQLNPSNILIEETDGYFYDFRQHTFRRDAYNFFNYNKLSLVDDDGNFNSYDDEYLNSKNSMLNSIKNKILNGKATVPSV